MKYSIVFTTSLAFYTRTINRHTFEEVEYIAPMEKTIIAHHHYTTYQKCEKEY